MEERNLDWEILNTEVGPDHFFLGPLARNRIFFSKSRVTATDAQSEIFRKKKSWIQGPANRKFQSLLNTSWIGIGGCQIRAYYNWMRLGTNLERRVLDGAVLFGHKKMMLVGCVGDVIVSAGSRASMLPNAGFGARRTLFGFLCGSGLRLIRKRQKSAVR